MAGRGAARHAGAGSRLPALATPPVPEERPHTVGLASAISPSIVVDNERERETTRHPLPRADLEVTLGLLERLRAEHREDMRKMDQQYREDMRKKDEQYREDMRRKDEQYREMLTKLLEQHSEALCKKDEQLERMVDKLSREHGTRTYQAPAGQLAQPQPHVVPMPSAARSASPSAGDAAPSPVQARRTQPETAAQNQSPIVPAPTAVPTEGWVGLLQGGGDEVEAALAALLESALEILEAVLMRTPRKQRKAVKAQCERAEAMLEELSSKVMQRLASCEAETLRALGEKLGAVQALRTVGNADMESVSVVKASLDELEKCSDVVVGSSRQLASTQAAVRGLGLEALAGLPRVVLEESVVTEVEAASLVLAVAADEGKADGERATALMCLLVLGLRNAGATTDALVAFCTAESGICAEIYDGRVQGSEGAAMCVMCTQLCILCGEVGVKSEAAVHETLEKAIMGRMMAVVNLSCPKARYQELLPLWLEATTSDDAVVASAACGTITGPLIFKTGKECSGTFFSCDPARVFWEMWQRLIEPGASATRWRPLARELSVESVCLYSTNNSLFLTSKGKVYAG
eukprot:COSAG05_NODE_3727_length_1878_cov_1.568859_1_plen_579_part_00